MSDKLRKCLTVVFLTLLVWTWAFLSQEESKPFNGFLKVSPATDPGLLVSFYVEGKDFGREVPLGLNFRGVPAKITELSRRTEHLTPTDPQKERLDFLYNPRDFGHTETRSYTLNLEEFLRQAGKTKELALTLESFTVNQKKVSQIEVHIEALQKKPLSVVCLEENGTTIENAISAPSQVEMYVQDGYAKPAYVTLTAQQIELARRTEKPVKEKPYVEMAGGRRYADEPVSITLQKTRLPQLPSRPFQTQKPIGFVVSQKLLNEYKIVIENETEIRSKIQILATDEAFKAYEKVPYPLLVEILDGDEKSTEALQKEVKWNFPPDYVRTGQIAVDKALTPAPRTAKVKLVPIAPPAVP